MAHPRSGLPLRRILDFVDIAAIAAEAEPGEVEHWARALGVGRLWSLTRRVQDTLFADAAPPVSLRFLGGAVLEVRDLTIVEQHKRRVLAGIAVLPVHRAIPHTLGQLVRELTPSKGETWSTKLRRMLLAARHAFWPSGAHHRTL